MQVKMVGNVAGQPSYYSGQIVDVGSGPGEMRQDIMKAWIAEGLCVPVREAPVETAKR